MRSDVHLRVAGVVAAVAVFSGGLIGVAAAEAAPGAGAAFGASASVTLLPGVLGDKRLAVDSGELAPSRSGGPLAASVVDPPLGGLVVAKAVTSSVVVYPETGGVRSTGAVAGASLPVLAGLVGRAPSAGVLRAECVSGPDGVLGSATLTGVGPGDAGGGAGRRAAEQAVGVPGVVEVVVNEQVPAADGSLTVNAMRLRLLGGSETGRLGSGDLVLGSATCGRADAAPPVRSSSPTPRVEAGRQVAVVPEGAPQTGDAGLR